MRYGGEGISTELICGGFLIDNSDVHPVLSSIPPFIHIRGEHGRPVEWLEASLKLLEAEMASGSAGADIVISRLTDVILTQTIREFFSRLYDGNGALLGALKDPGTAMAVSLIHKQTERSWTVPELASLVGMSRSAFSLRFKELTGLTPMRYLTQCRMANAATDLRSTDSNLIDIAQRIGYESEVSFSKAFKRHFGVAPGAYRKKQANLGDIPLALAASAN